MSKVQLETMIITCDPSEGVYWESAGVDIIFIDLETIGKQQRQGHIDSVKSDHKIVHIEPMKKALTISKVLVRINPWHDSTVDEVEAVIASGADIIMLPMFRTVEEVLELAKIVRNRCLLYPLIETTEAVLLSKELAKIKGVWGYHFSLNDLHLQLNMKFMFEVMLWEHFQIAIKHFQEAKVNFGIGGVTKIGQGLLPSTLVLSEYYRLGSCRTILSRSFKQEIDSLSNAKLEVSKLKEAFNSFSEDNLKENRSLFEKKVNRHISL